MLRQNVVHALRFIRRSPGLASVVILTLALGVGVNTAIFSVLNFLLLRPLPVPEPEQLVVMAERREGQTELSNVSRMDLEDFQSQAAAAVDLAAYQISQIGLSSAGQPERAVVTYVTGNFFTTLRVNPALGRLITPAEGQQLGADPVMVLGHHYWQKRFNGDPSIVGKTVVANGRALTVIGVAAESFHGPYALVDPDAYLPLGMAVMRTVMNAESGEFWTKRDTRNLRVIGRLKPSVELPQAQAALQAVADRMARDYPDSNSGFTVRLFPERSARPQPTESNALPAIGAVFLLLAGTVLLVACVNVANILLVRALARQREMAVRTSLGARRGQLLRASIMESVVLAALGGLAGIVAGERACALLESLRHQLDLPVYLNFGLDWRVFAYSFALALVTGLFVGVVPAWRASRANVAEVLHDGSRGSSVGVWHRTLQSTLVIGQVAGSLVLLVAAGLLLRSLQSAQRMELGFDPRGVLNVNLDPQLVGYDEARARAFYDELLIRVRALPGVRSASLALSVPFGYVHAEADVYPEGAVLPAGEHPPEVTYNAVDPGYFDNLRIALAKGRGFGESDAKGAPPVAVVNETMARRLWPNQDPIGRRFAMEKAGAPLLEVVGIAKDGKFLEPTDDAEPYFFVPVAQRFVSFRTLQLRADVPPESLIPEVERTIRALSPEMPLFDVRTMEGAMNGINGLFLFRLGAGLAGTLGGLGLLLAVLGVYGVVAHGVRRRSQEIGIRMALGAQRGHIIRLLLRQALAVVAIGIAVGLLLSLGVGQVIGSMLVGVSGSDPLTLVVVSGLLAAAALAASLLPTLRALRVDPNVTLRVE